MKGHLQHRVQVAEKFYDSGPPYYRVRMAANALAEKRRYYDSQRATNVLASLKAKLDQERSRLWMEEEREIQEQTQTARGNAADEREPLQEAVRLAQRVRGLLQIEVQSQQSTLRIYMPHTEKPSQPAKTEEPRGETGCNLGCSCP